MISQQLVNGILLGASYILVGLGFTLVIGVLRVINLGLPQIIVAGGFLTVLAGTVTGGNVVLTILGGVAGALVLGIIVHFIAIRPISYEFELGIFLSTFGAGMIIENALAAVFSPRPIRFPALVPNHVFDMVGVLVSLNQLTTAIGVALMLLGLWWVLVKTPYGRSVRAVAENPMMAAFCGINVRWIFLSTMGLASIFAGLAGIGLGMISGGLNPFMGHRLAVKGLTVMIVGGVGSVPGTLLAGLLLGCSEALTGAWIGSQYRDVVAFFLLALVLAFRPEGLIPGSQSIRRA
jgi:branched-chain amino acid transport system permease protein